MVSWLNALGMTNPATVALVGAGSVLVLSCFAATLFYWVVEAPHRPFALGLLAGFPDPVGTG